MRAVARDGHGLLRDVAISRPGGPPEVGEHQRGRVVRRAPALAGAFVALDRGPEGFLPDSAGGRGVTEGQAVLVEVTRAAQGGKGPRLTVRPGEAGSGPMARLAAAPDALARLRSVWPEAPLAPWDEAAEEALAALGEPAVALPMGGTLQVHPTPAVVALDLDMAGLAADRVGKTAAHAAFNRQAIGEVARQIRLRHLAGAIVVDLAGLSLRRRAALGQTFVEAIADDPQGARFLGFSALGLAEILRPRMHAPLHELWRGAYAAALAAAREWAAQAGRSGRRLGLAASPAVVEALAADACVLAGLRRVLGEAPRPLSDPTLPPLSWVVS